VPIYHVTRTYNKRAQSALFMRSETVLTTIQKKSGVKGHIWEHFVSSLWEWLQLEYNLHATVLTTRIISILWAHFVSILYGTLSENTLSVLFVIFREYFRFFCENTLSILWEYFVRILYGTLCENTLSVLFVIFWERFRFFYENSLSALWVYFVSILYAALCENALSVLLSTLCRCVLRMLLVFCEIIVRTL
jgi:hypothetical protein